MRPIAVGGDGTDIASAIRLGLASFRAPYGRLVLVSDGNATQETPTRRCAVTSSHSRDVLPLHYDSPCCGRFADCPGVVRLASRSRSI